MYTPKGNITAVANYLHTRGLFLDHPSIPSDMQRLKTQHYYNPHNPPPGGHRQALLGPNNRPGYAGPGGNSAGRWNAMGKSVEIQRSQVDELFKSMKDGDELPETEPRMFTYFEFSSRRRHYVTDRLPFQHRKWPRNSTRIRRRP